MFSFPLRIGEELRSPEFPTFLDATALSLFKSCPRKFFWQVLMETRAKGRNTHLHAGSIYASAHDVCRRHVYRGGSLEEGLRLGSLHLIREYGDFEPPEDGPASMKSKTWDRLLTAFILYYDVWHPSQDVFIPVALPDGQVGVEYSFAVPMDINHPVTEEPLLYAGRFDQLVHMCTSGWKGHYTDAIVNSPIFGHDDKTTYQMGATWAKQWTHRSQFLGYTWAQRRLGVNLRGFLIRGAAIQKTNIRHEQCVVMHPKWKIDAWEEMTLEVVTDLIVAWRSGVFHQMFDDACGSYGGCSYAGLCDTPRPEARLHEFAIHKWNPVNED